MVSPSCGSDFFFLQRVYMFLVFPYDMLNVGLMESNRLAQLWQVYVTVLSTERGMKKCSVNVSFTSPTLSGLGLTPFPLPCHSSYY